ncbi:MAG TPA: hypothetical protein VEB60_03395 [Candidatus Paceibacterota bacterium]|nr:hypothetical protein [Candidatus Paceibacterota bacterium]
MQNKIIRIALVTASILLIPLVGRWPWTLGDFVLMGTLIFGTGLTLDFAIRKTEKKYRTAVAAAILAGFLLIWTQLAVGLLSKMVAGGLCVLDRGVSAESFISCDAEVRPR